MVGLAVVVGGAAFVLKSTPPNLVACFSGQPPRGGELHTDLIVDSRIKTMAFTMRISQISGGAVSWSVQDPNGKSPWSGREETMATFESGALTASAGTWRINVVSEADAITYGLFWHSLDPAVTANDPICGAPL
jgi:hypothetical protein